MKKQLLLLTFFVATVAMNAQTAANRWSLGAGVGFTDFVNPISKQFLMVDKWKGAANFNIARYLGKTFDGRLNVTTGEAYYPYVVGQANQTVPADFSPAVEGNMAYDKSYIWDGGLNLVLKLANGSILKETSTIKPYLFSGLGINNITKIGDVADGREGSTRTSGGAGEDQMNPYLPLGFGFKVDLNDRWNASAEAAYKMALGEAYNYVNSNFRLGFNFGGAGSSSTAPAVAAASTAAAVAAASEPGANASWCNNHKWKVGVGPTFNSFEAVQREQNFMLDDYTTSLGLTLSKYMNRFFDVRANLGFGNVYYPHQPGASEAFDGDNWMGTTGSTNYGSAQMIDLNLQPVFKFANGTWMKENAIFSPYIYAGPGVSYITSIGTWNENMGGPVSYGTDDVNMHVGTGLGLNFRTSEKFAIQLEGARNWKLDNSYSYNQANLRGLLALGNCGANTTKSTDNTKETNTKVVDSDNDGIPDLTDECPYVAGKAEFFGCPDSDGDGIGDSKDKCPFEAGVASNGGCPEMTPVKDADGDGVIDANDKCPDVAGPASNNGCPTTKTSTSTSTSTSTTTTTSSKSKTSVGSYELFFSGCSTLSPGQVETLQQIASTLRNNPNYSVEIGGHTSKGGSKSCAQQRADKIASLLKMKGVNVSNSKKSSYGDSRQMYNSSKDDRAEIQIYSFE